MKVKDKHKNQKHGPESVLDTNIQTWQTEVSPVGHSQKCPCLLPYWCHTGPAPFRTFHPRFLCVEQCLNWGNSLSICWTNECVSSPPIEFLRPSYTPQAVLPPILLWSLQISKLFPQSSLLLLLCQAELGLKQMKTFLLGICVFLVKNGKQTTVRNERLNGEETYGKCTCIQFLSNTDTHTEIAAAVFIS